jgi:hypothetical protein
MDWVFFTRTGKKYPKGKELAPLELGQGPKAAAKNYLS